MKIRYENDEQRGPGHGLLRCTGETFPEGRYSLILERASEPRFLGNQGWTDQRSPLEVEAVQAADESLTLLVGPRIVDLLDSLATYRATVQAENGEQFTAGLGFRNIDIRYSPAGQTGNVPGQTGNVPDQTSESEPESSRESEISLTESASEPETILEPNDIPEPPPVPPPPPPPPPPKKGKALLIGAILALLILAIGGGAAWYFLKMKQPDKPPISDPPQQGQTQEKPEQPSPPDQPRQPETPPAPPEQPRQPEIPPEQPPAPPTAQGTVERVNAFFADAAGRTPAGAAQLSREVTTDTPQDQDAAYRLLYFAAEQGEASAYMDYAACLDPAKPQWGSITKDARAAWTIYEKAKATQPEAAQAQQNMRAWLEQQAASGNRDAILRLRDLPPAQP